ncbi:chromosome partitioning protein, ParB family [Streptomyces sp. KS_16]|nr:ParB family chromosome partitioning protein [Streptomyces sp. 2321.6]SDR62128.1 chromosome partitioning protein, ParB family [Streptomyces sp. KS_16]SEE50461.1 chromosome partitioning protein, ParB family [Streptomyces sp. 2133.1]SNC77840.1 chromosome partitioning protein, ParB family [Streptomyces sp. 2114.4]
MAAATEAPTEGAGGRPNSKLPTHLISENPDNPREALGDVSDLAQTLLEVGLVNPISVVTVDAYLAERPDRSGELEGGAQYVVVDGHRRLAAAREAGLKEIKYSLDDAFAVSDEKLLEAAYVANAHRENMSELEEAAALEKLVAFYGSQRKAAQRLGITQAFISQRLSLLQLDPTLQADLDAGARKVEHVRGLSKLPPQQQREKADERAAEATKKAEKRKDRQEGTPEAAGDNAVITVTPRTLPEASSAPPSAPSDNAVITSEGVDVHPEEAPVESMPFHSWSDVLRILRARMTPEEFERLMQEGQKLI